MPFSAIHIYSRDGDMDGLIRSIADGDDVNRIDSIGDTPLHYASANGHIDIVNVLLAAGAEVDKTNNAGKTPLFRASDNGQFDVVKILIRAKADVCIQNNKGKSPVDVGKTKEIRDFIHQHHPSTSSMATSSTFDIDTSS